METTKVLETTHPGNYLKPCLKNIIDGAEIRRAPVEEKVVYLIIYKVLPPSQVVVWDSLWTINSITTAVTIRIDFQLKKKYPNHNLTNLFITLHFSTSSPSKKISNATPIKLPQRGMSPPNRPTNNPRQHSTNRDTPKQSTSMREITQIRQQLYWFRWSFYPKTFPQKLHLMLVFLLLLWSPSKEMVSISIHFLGFAFKMQKKQIEPTYLILNGCWMMVIFLPWDPHNAKKSPTKTESEFLASNYTMGTYSLHF